MQKEEKLNAFVERLEARPDVLSVILFGSHARGDNRPDSDIDLVVILSDGHQRAVEYYDGQAFEIVYVTEQAAVEYWKAHRHDAAGLWSVAKVLFDRDGTGDRLKSVGQAIASEPRQPLESGDIAHLRFDQEDALRAVESLAQADPATAALLLQKKIAGLLETYFDLRQEWIPPTKQQLKRIRGADRALSSLFDRFYRAGSLEEAISLAKLLVSHVFDEAS